MKIFLTGASGVMGRSAIVALHEAGHDVVGFVRTEDKAKHMAAQGVEPALGEIFDENALVLGMRQCDVVCNLATKVPVGVATAIPGAWKRNDRIRTEGTRTLSSAAKMAGVPRIVQESLSFVYGDHGDDWIDESSPIDVSRVTEPVVLSESTIDGFVASGGEGVALRFGLITGTDPASAWLLRQARAGRAIANGARNGWCHVVHPDDVGTAVVAALAAPSGTYNVGAEPLRRHELADLYAHAAGKSEGKFHGRMYAKLGGDKVEFVSRSQRVSSQRLGNLTGWYPQFPKVVPEWFDDIA